MRRKLGATCISCLVALGATAALGLGGYSTLTGKTLCSLAGCDKAASRTTKVVAQDQKASACCAAASRTTKVAAQEASTCSKARAQKVAAQKVAAKGDCACKGASEAIEARLVKAKASYESACEGECSVTTARAKNELITAKLAVAKRDCLIAKAKFAKASLTNSEFAYESACAGKCEVSKAKTKAALLKSRVNAYETFTKIAAVAECGACGESSRAKMTEAKVSLATYEYEQAAAGTCEKSKAAAKANLEKVCGEAGVCAKSAAADVEKASDKKVSSKADKVSAASTCSKARAATKVAAKDQASACCAVSSKAIKIAAKEASTCSKARAATKVAAKDQASACCAASSKTTKVAAQEAATCSKAGAQKVAATCTWRQNNDAIDAAVVKTVAAYESACEGECSVTKGKTKGAMLVAKLRQTERDYLMAKAKYMKVRVAAAENGYETACAGECSATRAATQAKLLQAKVDAERVALKAATFVDCAKCINGHTGALNEATIANAKFEYEQACAGTCEKSKEAAKVRLEGLKAQLEKGEPVASR